MADIIARDDAFNKVEILKDHMPDSWGKTRPNVNISHAEIPNANENVVFVGDVEVDAMRDGQIIVGKTNARYNGVYLGENDFNNSIDEYDNNNIGVNVVIGHNDISDQKRHGVDDLITIGECHMYSTAEGSYSAYNGVFIGHDIYQSGTTHGYNVAIGKNIHIEPGSEVSNDETKVIGSNISIRGGQCGTYIGSGYDMNDKPSPHTMTSNDFVAVCNVPYIGNEDFLFVVGSAEVGAGQNALTVYRNGGARFASTVHAPNYMQDSSIRFKKNVADITADDAKKIMDVRAVTFEYKYKDGTRAGVIAEEINNVFPHLVGHDHEGRIESVDYVGLVPYLVKMVQMQAEEIEALKCQIEKKN